MVVGLPDGFELAQEGSVLVAIRRGAEEELEPLLAGRPEHALPEVGRGSAWLFPRQGRPGHGVVYKRFQRGGLLGWFFRELRVGYRRLFEELAVSQAAYASGLDVPQILAVRATRHGPGLYSADAFYREIPHVTDLVGYLRRPDVGPDWRARREVVREAAAAIRRAHDAGLWHADLNAWNVLVQRRDLEQIPRIFLVDLDRARWSPGLGFEERAANLARLHRSAHKIEALCAVLTRTDFARFLKAYGGDAPLGRGEKRRLTARCRRALAWHRFWWRLAGRGEGRARGLRA